MDPFHSFHYSTFFYFHFHQQKQHTERSVCVGDNKKKRDNKSDFDKALSYFRKPN